MSKISHFRVHSECLPRPIQGPSRLPLFLLWVISIGCITYHLNIKKLIFLLRIVRVSWINLIVNIWFPTYFEQLPQNQRFLFQFRLFDANDPLKVWKTSKRRNTSVFKQTRPPSALWTVEIWSLTHNYICEIVFIAYSTLNGTETSKERPPPASNKLIPGRHWRN